MIMRNIQSVCQKLGYEMLTDGSAEPIRGGYSSDLLSDVIANCPEGSVWVTVQRHLNVIAVAQLKGVLAIVFPNGVMPETALLEKARQEGIALVRSTDNPFVTTGRIYAVLDSAST